MLGTRMCDTRKLVAFDGMTNSLRYGALPFDCTAGAEKDAFRGFALTLARLHGYATARFLHPLLLFDSDQGETMFTPHSLGVALFMMITSAICWGSWANTYKGVKNYRFELFYWDYAVGIFLVSLILALTMGSTGNDASSFLNNVRSADTNNIVSTMVGGAIFNLANLLLVAAIDMAGLAIAFPVAIGIALVVGVILSYALQPKGSAFSRGGVVCALIAVCWTEKPTAVWRSPAARFQERASSSAWYPAC